MPITALSSTEPIPGYELQERIGAGGYGEVWRASAPGGLEKAVKFVYGYMDEERATRELKALSRIKEVRHPFLLSLERIEVIEGQLVVVTELADGTLKDRFDECTAKGLAGVPRDELLAHLRDAADALDFMSESFSLQHLDVKPDNLLLVGGRIKVADFGLVKHLQDVTASLMGGLTPLYAAPEVYDGRPSLLSDQYSLAVVYQEMLTGVLPFSGTTAAQLATQHLSAKPRVTPLPATDQPIIARALAKEPGERFANCRELIDYLSQPQKFAADMADAAKSNAGHATSASANDLTRTQATAVTNDRRSELAASSAPVNAGNYETHRTEAYRSPSRRNTPTSRPSRRGPSIVLPSRHPSPEIETLPPLEFDGNATQLRPTILIGVGGAAAKVLQSLRARLDDRFGRHNTPAAVSMLLLDTDMRVLMQASQSDTRGTLDAAQTLAVPLRKAQHYRNMSKGLLKSMSRRWLYNIPRSQQTEGLRPLGRLAFVDHSEQILARLKEVISTAMSPEAIASSAKTTGLKFAKENPRVFIVSSIAGGSGGGMVAELAYAVRKTLTDLGCKDDVSAILTHATNRNPAAKDLANVNALACLSEIQHYSRPDHAYPGDDGCRLPPSADDKRPFDDAYLVHFGDDLTDDQFDAAAETVADYLYLDAVTPCAGLLEQARATRRDDSNENLLDTKLRTFAICRVGGSEDDVAAASELLCQNVLKIWLGEESKKQNDGSPVNLDALSMQLVDQMQLEIPKLCEEFRDAIAKRFSQPIKQRLQSILQRAFPIGEHSADLESSAAATAQARNVIDATLDARDEDDEDIPPKEVWQRELAALMKQRNAALVDAIGQWIQQLVDSSPSRMRGAQQAADWFDKQLDQLIREAREKHQQITEEISQLAHTLDTLSSPEAVRALVQAAKSRKGESVPDSKQTLSRYFAARVDEIALHGVGNFLPAIRGHVGRLVDQLRDLRREVSYLAGQFNPPPFGKKAMSGDEPADAMTQVQQAIAIQLKRRVPELVVELDQSFRREFFGAESGLRKALTTNVDFREAVPAAMRSAARRLVLEARNRLDVAALMLSSGEDHDQTDERLRQFADIATPRLLECGGARRLLLALPQHASHDELCAAVRRELGEAPSIVLNDDGEAVICCEAEQISIAQVVATLFEDRPDYAEVASRVYTRNDITWSPWDGLTS